MKPLRPPPDSGPLRKRPSDGQPRCVVEELAQLMYRRRAGIALAYIAVSTTVAVVLELRP